MLISSPRTQRSGLRVLEPDFRARWETVRGVWLHRGPQTIHKQAHKAYNTSDDMIDRSQDMFRSRIPTRTHAHIRAHTHIQAG